MDRIPAVALPFTASLLGPVAGRSAHAGSNAAMLNAKSAEPSRFNILVTPHSRPKIRFIVLAPRHQQ